MASFRCVNLMRTTQLINISIIMLMMNMLHVRMATLLMIMDDEGDDGTVVVLIMMMMMIMMMITWIMFYDYY